MIRNLKSMMGKSREICGDDFPPAKKVLEMSGQFPETSFRISCLFFRKLCSAERRHSSYGVLPTAVRIQVGLFLLKLAEVGLCVSFCSSGVSPTVLCREVANLGELGAL